MPPLNAFQEKFAELFAKANPSNETEKSKVIAEALQWSVQNFESLDKDSQEAVDELLKIIRQGARSLVETMQDNPLSRQLRRVASDDRLMAKSLVHTLVGDTKQPTELVAM